MAAESPKSKCFIKIEKKNQIETIRVSLDATSDNSHRLHLILKFIRNRMRITKPYPLIFSLTRVTPVNVSRARWWNDIKYPSQWFHTRRYRRRATTTTQINFTLWNVRGFFRCERSIICIQSLFFVQIFCCSLLLLISIHVSHRWLCCGLRRTHNAHSVQRTWSWRRLYWFH